MTERDIFLALIDLPDAVARAAFLDQACAGQPRLRAAVEALLAAHEASGVLDRPAAELGQTVDSDPGPDPSVATGEHTPDPGDAPPQVATSDNHPRIAPGTVIAGRYTLVEKIGEGGMGEVWVARQTETLKRKVALKLIKTGMNTRAVLARFEQERQALAMMDHPNIARVLDGGMTPTGQPFFVMELVNGLPLTRFCDEARLTPKERLELFVPICQAVQHAHQKAIVHRDLKPANILVTLIDGRPVPKVIDFGVAKAIGGKLTDESMATQFGAVVGTLEYMSPEQAGFSGQDIDTRADIYSLGVILYELLTGLRPIDARRLKKAALTEMIRLIQEEEPARPSTRLSTDEALPSLAALRQTEPRKLMALLRGELDWVVMKCLEKPRDRRYETANALARDIQRYLADEPVEARPPSRGYRLKKFVRRNRGPVVAAGLVVLALVGGVIGTTAGLFEARAQEKLARHEAEEKDKALTKAVEEERKAVAEAKLKEAARADEEVQRKLATKNEALAKERLEETRYVAALDLILLAQSAFETGNVDLANARLEQVAPEFRRWEWHFLRRQFEGGMLTIYGHYGTVSDLAYSPDGKRLLAVDRTRSAVLWDARTGEKLRSLGEDRATADCCDYSPDGTRVVTAGGHRATLWDPATGRPVCDLKGKADRVRSVRFSPDGTKLVTGHEDTRVRLWDAKTGDLIREFAGHVTEESAAFQDVAKGLGLAAPMLILNTVVAFSPDGRRVASGATRSAKVWDVETGALVLDLRGHPAAVVSVAFAPDGKHLLTGSSVGGSGRVVFWDASTGTAVRELHSSKLFAGLTISPDGQYLAAPTATGLQVLDVTSGALLQEFRGHSTVAAFSPDGSRIATASGSGAIKVWDAREGTPPRKLYLQEGARRQPAAAAVRGTDDTASANWASGVILWDTAAGRPRQTLAQPRAVAVATSPDGKQLATGGADGSVKLWETASGKFLRDLPGHKAPVTRLVYTPDGTRLLSASEDGTARVLNPASGDTVHTLTHSGPCLWIAADATGARLVTSEGPMGRSRVRLWDAGTGSPVRELTAPTPGGFLAVAFGAGAKRVFGACTDGTVYVWEAESGSLVARLEGHQGRVNGMDLTPDGSRVATGGQDRVARLWDTRTGTQLLKLTPYTQSATTMSFDARGEWLTAGCYDGIVRLFDGRPSPSPPTLAGHGGEIQCLAWNPDGSRLATGGRDGTVTVWDPPTRKPLHTFPARAHPGRTGWVDGLAFSPDGARLGVTSSGRFITVHDAGTGEVVRPVHESQDRWLGGAQALRYSADGKKLVHSVELSRWGPLVIDVASGRVLNEDPPPLAPLSAISPRGDVVALTAGNVVKLIPMTVSDAERAERVAAAEPRVQFHWDEYQRALAARNATAAAFHRKRMEGFGEEYARLRVESSRQNTNSGLQELRLGKWDVALDRLQQAVELDPANTAAATGLARARKAATEFRLALYRKGEYLPGTTADRLDLVAAAAERKWHRTAVELYRLAFAADPALATDPKAGHRLAAARCAVRAGFGKAGDDPPPDEKTRASWRARALDWLKGELTARRKLAPDTLASWLTDPDLSLARPGPDRIELAPAERADWDAFWQDVAAADPKPATPTRPPMKW